MPNESAKTSDPDLFSNLTEAIENIKETKRVLDEKNKIREKILEDIRTLCEKTEDALAKDSVAENLDPVSRLKREFESAQRKSEDLTGRFDKIRRFCGAPTFDLGSQRNRMNACVDFLEKKYGQEHKVKISNSGRGIKVQIRRWNSVDVNLSCAADGNLQVSITRTPLGCECFLFLPLILWNKVCDELLDDVRQNILDFFANH